MMWVRLQDEQRRRNFMTSYRYNGNNAKFKFAIGVLIDKNIDCVSFIFVLNGVVEIFQFNKLLVMSFLFLDDVCKIEYFQFSLCFGSYKV